MLRMTLIACTAALLFACEKSEQVPDPGKSAAPPASSPTAGTPAPKTATEKLGEAASTAKQILDPKAVADPSFSVDKLKQSLGGVSSDNLKKVADELVASFKSKGDSLKSLQDQLGKLGLTDIGKAGEIKQNIDSTSKLMTQLKDKLKVVTDQLKASGVDVSSYTALIGG